MKKIIVLGFIFLASIAKSFAQDYQELLVMYVEEDYEKCFAKSIKYTENDKTKKDALPYLYASMASYAMSQDHKYSEDYPKAYKTALSFLAKYRKKDKTYDYREDAEEYIEKVKFVIMEEADNYFLEATEKSYKKALSLIKKVTQFDPNCYGALLLKGELDILTKNKTEGKKVVAEALEKIKTIGTEVQFGDMTESQQMYLKRALIEYAKYIQKIDLSRAKEVISLGQEFFYEKREDCLLEDNKDFIKVYDEITNK